MIVWVYLEVTEVLFSLCIPTLQPSRSAWGNMKFSQEKKLEGKKERKWTGNWLAGIVKGIFSLKKNAQKRKKLRNIWYEEQMHYIICFTNSHVCLYICSTFRQTMHKKVQRYTLPLMQWKNEMNETLSFRVFQGRRKFNFRGTNKRTQCMQFHLVVFWNVFHWYCENYVKLFRTKVF